MSIENYHEYYYSFNLQAGGACGPQNPLFLPVSNSNTDDISGEVKALALIYCGEYAESVESYQYDFVRLQIGVNPDSFSWKTEPNDDFQTPQARLYLI